MYMYILNEDCDLLQYALDRLKLQCEELLATNLQIENVCDVLVLADMHSAEQLRARCIEFINWCARTFTFIFTRTRFSHCHCLCLRTADVLRCAACIDCSFF